MKTSRISNEHRLVFSVLWTVSTSRRFSRCCWLDKKNENTSHERRFMYPRLGFKRSIIEGRSMTSRHHGRTICGWQQNQRQRRQDGRRMAKKVECFYWQNKKFARASHYFVHFFTVVAPLRHEASSYHTLALWSRWTQHKSCLFSLLNLDTVLSDSTRGHFANICQIKWNWISSMKFERCEFTF